MSRVKILMFIGSVREGRVCERVSKLMKKELEKASMDCKVFDPLVMNFELLRKPLHFHQDPTQAPDWLREADAEIQKADGFLIVTPEYNSTIPPALSNMLDHFSPMSYAYRPVGFASYSPGGFGGCRVAMALRPFVADLGMAALPMTLCVPTVGQSIDEEGNAVNDLTGKSATSLITNLKWYAEAMKKQHETAGLPT